MGSRRFQFYCKQVTIVAFIAATLTACSSSKLPQVSSQASTGPISPTPTPAPGSTDPKSVAITWAASHAKDVGATGGGYKVWVHAGTAPTTTNTTPVVILNPGDGSHITTSTASLTPGRYYVSVSSYSSNGDSPLSTPILLVVP